MSIYRVRGGVGGAASFLCGASSQGSFVLVRSKFTGEGSGDLNTNNSIHWLIYLPGIPFIIGGGLNFASQVMSDSDWPRLLKARIWGSNTITHTQVKQACDYFLVDDQLRREVTRPFPLPEVNLKPHFSVGMRLASKPFRSPANNTKNSFFLS